MLETAALVVSTAFLIGTVALSAERLFWIRHQMWPAKPGEPLLIGYDGKARSMDEHLDHEIQTFGGGPPKSPFAGATTRLTHQEEADNGAEA